MDSAERRRLAVDPAVVEDERMQVAVTGARQNNVAMRSLWARQLVDRTARSVVAVPLLLHVESG